MSEIGDKIWVVPSGNAGRYRSSPHVATIIEMNNKSLIVSGDGLFKLTISKKTLKATGVKDCNSHYQAYLTEQDYLNVVERAKIWQTLRNIFGTFACPENLTLIDLQDILKIIEKIK